MMFTMPVYDMMLLPGVTFYFKKDIFQQMGNQDANAQLERLRTYLV